MRFRDQVVWITGASSGIGEALARAFAAEGATLVLSSRRSGELERVRQSCAGPDRHAVLPLDLLDRPALIPAVSRVRERFGGVDVLVNNAGVSQRALALEATEESERRILELDYFAPVALTKAVVPLMLARPPGAGGIRGRIAVVSSVMGYVGTPGRSSYAAAKHALHGYFDSLRAEVHDRGLRVTLACPGYVRTAVSDNALGPDGRARPRREATHERGTSPEGCARAILRGVAHGRNEVYVGGWEVAGIYLQRYLPGVYARLVRRMRWNVSPTP